MNEWWNDGMRGPVWPKTRKKSFPMLSLPSVNLYFIFRPCNLFITSPQLAYRKSQIISPKLVNAKLWLGHIPFIFPGNGRIPQGHISTYSWQRGKPSWRSIHISDCFVRDLLSAKQIILGAWLLKHFPLCLESAVTRSLAFWDVKFCRWFSVCSLRWSSPLTPQLSTHAVSESVLGDNLMA